MHGLSRRDLEKELPNIVVHRQPFLSKDGAAIDSFAGVAVARGAPIF